MDNPRLVDLRKEARKERPYKFSIDEGYLDVEQPMPIFYSRDAVLKYYFGKRIVIIENISQFTNLLQRITDSSDLLDLATNEKRNYYSIRNIILIRTSEKFMPKDIHPKRNKYSEIERTHQSIEGFIRLYKVKFYSAGRQKLLTSSGVFFVNMVTYDRMTVAFPKDYKSVMVLNDVRKRDQFHKLNTYEHKLARILDGNRPKLADVRLFNLIFNPYSTAYLDIDKAIKRVYPIVKRQDRKKVINSKKFRELFMKEMVRMMPNLIEGIQKHNSPDDIGLFIKLMRDKAIEKGTTDDQMKVLALALQTGYGAMVANPSANENVPLILDGKFQTTDARLISTRDEYRDQDIKPLTMPDNMEEVKIVGEGNDNPEKVEEEETDEEFQKDLVEHGVLGGTVEGY